MTTKESIFEIIDKCHNDVNSRDNAVTVYHTILNHYELIEFEKDIDHQNFDRHLEELKESLIIENKELFSQKFALQLLNLKKYLRKAEIY